MTKGRQGLLGLLHHEAAGGIVLLVAALLAIATKNSFGEAAYDSLLAAHLKLGWGSIAIDLSVLHWINDGLMAIFFFLVGLEIKKELLAGALSTRDRAILPAVGAIGGMIVPALIYVTINAGNAAALRGWAIPAATDIAFAVGVLTLLGPRVPASLKVFLLALAILDDLGAILIIAFFYSTGLSLPALIAAAAVCGALVMLNRRNGPQTWPYLLAATVLWICVLKSGLHATLAGVVAAMAIPLRPSPATESNAKVSDADAPSQLEGLENRLHPWVAFGVLPAFAFANAGVSLSGFSLPLLSAPVPLGIALGLFLGKSIGISAAVWLAVATGLSRLPEGATWSQVCAVATIAGIGFTMSLFIGMLAFPDPGFATPLRVGVLAGSFVSAVVGLVFLWLATRPAATST